ncbi:MAG: precorrin-3B C(17)-methyltransferase [Planctomycetes bacterium]|nr:precorrin-3B C(17)-methyltransferase [Planctomycetota bacterium]
MSENKGQLFLVGIGPGNEDHMTPAALDAIKQSDLVIGYVTYIKLVKHLLEGKEVIRAGMTEEMDRARKAIELAQQGRSVALISSGDAGVYGMSGLIFEILKETGWKKGDSPDIHLIPGVTAMNACASLVGSPLTHDYCCISLSDLLTPWAVIEKRIKAAAMADFVLGLYNPKSEHRTEQIIKVQKLISAYRVPQTPVALVQSAYRRKEHVVITDLAHFLEEEIGMLTTVIIGNSQTFLFENYMVTPRGYANKYQWDGQIIKGQSKARSLVVDEAIL